MNELILISTAFRDKGIMPLKFTYTSFSKQSLNYSPPLIWENAPESTKSFALICTDPDNVSGVFTHWIVYNIPNYFRALSENFPKEALVALRDVKFDRKEIICQGLNDYMHHGYHGPNPSVGTGVHRYVFTLYALGRDFECKPSMARVELEKLIEGHVLARAEFIGMAGISG